MRIGELLLAHGWVDPAGLTRAISEQAQAGRRLCSLLIARGLLDHDIAARALAEQHGVPGVLLRHLEGREAGLAFLIPPELGRTRMALPIGRTSGGELIVCVRDPSAETKRALEHATRGAVVIAVSPASRLEQLVASVYGDEENADFDVDLSTGPITMPIDAPDPMDVGAAQFRLVDLDDARVSKDHTQSGQFGSPRDGLANMPRKSAPMAAVAAPEPAPPAAPAPQPGPVPMPAAVPSLAGVARAAAAAVVATSIPSLSQAPAPAPAPARIQLPAPAPTLDATIAALETAPSRDDATDVAMAYVAGRWASSLLVTIKEGAALGHRGHGVHLGVVETIALPMSSPSMLKIAHDTRRATGEMPAGAIQDRLGRLLGQPTAPAAAPIVVGGRVIGAIAVGDSLHGVGDAVDATSDLEYVTEALGLAYARILIETKQRLSSPSITSG